MPNRADDPWAYRPAKMRCITCMWFVPKALESGQRSLLGRCRRHAPGANGFVPVYESDWCGDHRLDEAACTNPEMPDEEDSEIATEVQAEFARNGGNLAEAFLTAAEAAKGRLAEVDRGRLDHLLTVYEAAPDQMLDTSKDELIDLLRAAANARFRAERREPREGEGNLVKP